MTEIRDISIGKTHGTAKKFSDFLGFFIRMGLCFALFFMLGNKAGAGTEYSYAVKISSYIFLMAGGVMSLLSAEVMASFVVERCFHSKDESAKNMIFLGVRILTLLLSFSFGLAVTGFLIGGMGT